MQYSNSTYTITGEYTDPKEQTIKRKLKSKWIIDFDNRLYKGYTILQNNSIKPKDSPTVKEINEAASKIQS